MPKHARGENQQLHRLLLLLVNTRHCATQGKEGKTQPVRWFYQHRSYRGCFIMHTAESCFHHATCQYCWLSMLRGVISQHTYRPVMKVEERHGVSAHQRQPGTSLHCARACTSANWFSKAGTCPRHKTADSSMNRTVKSAYCTNLLSHQISIEHL